MSSAFDFSRQSHVCSWFRHSCSCVSILLVEKLISRSTMLERFHNNLCDCLLSFLSVVRSFQVGLVFRYLWLEKRCNFKSSHERIFRPGWDAKEKMFTTCDTRYGIRRRRRVVRKKKLLPLHYSIT